jgi:gliding motility-associated-like protein
MNPLFKSILTLVFSYALVADAQLNVPDQANESCIVYIPTAISPNGDGINDSFVVQQVCTLEGYQLKIYNAAQGVLYQSVDAKSAWDGQYQGDPQPEGFYTWELTFYDPRTGNRVLQRGEFALVR